MVHSFNHYYMKFQHNDGGRSKYTSIASKHDCVVRAVAIATGLDYWTVYQDLVKLAPALESEGVNVGSPAFAHYLRGLGFVRVDGITAMQDIPAGTVIASTTGHLTAIVNGTIQDVRDESSKAVPYYWVRGHRFNLVREGIVINSAPLNGVQAMTMRGSFARYRPQGAYIHLQAV